MKHKRLWIFLPLLSLVAAALGCNLPSQTQPTAAKRLPRQKKWLLPLRFLTLNQSPLKHLKCCG